MSRKLTLLMPALTLLALLTLVAAGCNKTDQGTGGAASGAGDAGATASDDQSGADQEEEASIAKALAELSPEDRAAAEKQKVCPVTGERLGAMGTPKKIHVKDRDVFICCGGCEEDLKADPDKYFAKLDK